MFYKQKIQKIITAQKTANQIFATKIREHAVKIKEIEKKYEENLKEIEEKYKTAYNKCWKQLDVLLKSENECRLAIGQIIKKIMPANENKKPTTKKGK